ncbi:MAG TPA: amidohydrolase family protein [Cytophagaceae bacterium]|jgi:L-fuconolactonase
MKIIDTHVHFWNYKKESLDFSWIADEMAILKNDYLPENFMVASETLQKQSSTQCIAVQARQSLEETMFLLELAQNNPMIAGVVGWVNWSNPDIGKTYTDLAKYKKLKGFRHIIQDEQEGFMSNSTFRHSICKIGCRFTYDLLIKPHQLLEAFELVSEFPEQPFVIDHLAKPLLKSHDLAQWTLDIKKFKSEENVYCKLSGLVTEAHWNQWREDDFTYALNVVLETFGPKRLMFGSDWPVCLLASDYRGVYDIINNFLEKQSRVNREDVMYNNALKFYRL